MLRIAFAPIYKYELPEGHRFPMAKYELIAEQLLFEGSVTEANFFHPDPLPEAVALLTHDQAYWNKLNTVSLTEKEVRAIGFPINEKFVWRGRHIAQGTIQCAHFALEQGVAMNEFQPDFVFYLSGVDVLATDKLGRLGLSRAGCRQRDHFVLDFCQRRRLPVVVCMGGGYSPRLADIVEAQANTFRVANELFF